MIYYNNYNTLYNSVNSYSLKYNDVLRDVVAHELYHLLEGQIRIKKICEVQA